FMVAPGEIEAFLMSHPDVDQAFVVGVPDADTNEAPVAYVIARPHARLGEEELRAFCRGKIASYKIPRIIRFVADVPRTPSPHGDPASIPEATVRDVQRTLNGFRTRLGLTTTTAKPPAVPDVIDAAFDVIVEERVPVWSIGLGNPSPEQVGRCHARGIKVMAM